MPPTTSIEEQWELNVGDRNYHYIDVIEYCTRHGLQVEALPYCLRVLLENLIRNWTGPKGDMYAAVLRLFNRKNNRNGYMDFYPGRVLMQDYSGMPVLIDFAGLRDQIAETTAGGRATSVTPSIPVDFVVDHSLIVNESGSATAYSVNLDNEFRRNDERYRFLRWAEQAFDKFRIFPPGSGILHQLNMENIASVVSTTAIDGNFLVFPDTVVGTDSHTTMINCAGVLGWGVGGIDAQAAALGEPLTIRIPEVTGVRIVGAPIEGVTATDIVLSLTETLRQYGVVDSFVEFFGPSLYTLSLADRGTIANMAPEFGCTCAFFPIDELTIDYLRDTARSSEQIQLVENYARAQKLYRDINSVTPSYDRILEFNLSAVETCIAGPRKPQEKIVLSNAPEAMRKAFPSVTFPSSKSTTEPSHGDIVLAAITSCTTTSNPALMFGAGLLAENAVKLGLKVQPWVKTSFTPGSSVVAGYLNESGLQKSLDQLGFQVAGFACGACSGNSGDLSPAITDQIVEQNLLVCSVLSGNRNFEGRIHPHIKANFLMAPALVIAYALLGRMTQDIRTAPLGVGKDGKNIFLKQIWPSDTQIRTVTEIYLRKEIYKRRYDEKFPGQARWDAVPQQNGERFQWSDHSTYLRRPKSVDLKHKQPQTEIRNARLLLLLGDGVTTDHISPVGDIALHSPAADYLESCGVELNQYNTYGARRGNHEVMIRGAFSNKHLSNAISGTPRGPYTRHFPSGEVLDIYDAAKRYEMEKVPLVILAGKNYGGGSARDWAARGTKYLGVKAIIAQSYERIHRANLVNMGIHALELPDGTTLESLDLDGSEYFDIDLPSGFGEHIRCCIKREKGSILTLFLRSRLDNPRDFQIWKCGGIDVYLAEKYLRK